MHRPDIPVQHRPTVSPQPTPRRPRLGVLTFHRCINYGSYWQARCLVDGLRELGHDAVLLDHHDGATEWREWRCALQPLLPERSSAADRRRYAAKTRSFAAALAELPRSARFALRGGVLPADYDAIVVGSDEVWNPSHPWYGDAGLFWGQGLGAVPLIAHAVSSGGHAAPLAPERAEAIRRFRHVAVRDRTTRAHVLAATGQEPALVLDPCLQFPPRGVGPLARKPYALVYGHEFPGWAGPATRDWAVRAGLDLLSIGYRNDFADEQWLEAGPVEVASAVAGAAAVVTTMFHGCVFALNAGVPFAAIPSPYRGTKVLDLLDLLEAEAHLVQSPDRIAAALDHAPETAIARRIGDLRSHSRTVLAGALA